MRAVRSIVFGIMMLSGLASPSAANWDHAKEDVWVDSWTALERDFRSLEFDELSATALYRTLLDGSEQFAALAHRADVSVFLEMVARAAHGEVFVPLGGVLAMYEHKPATASLVAAELLLGWRLTMAPEIQTTLRELAVDAESEACANALIELLRHSSSSSTHWGFKLVAEELGLGRYVDTYLHAEDAALMSTSQLAAMVAVSTEWRDSQNLASTLRISELLDAFENVPGLPRYTFAMKAHVPGEARLVRAINSIIEEFDAEPQPISLMVVGLLHKHQETIRQHVQPDGLRISEDMRELLTELLWPQANE